MDGVESIIMEVSSVISLMMSRTRPDESLDAISPYGVQTSVQYLLRMRCTASGQCPVSVPDPGEEQKKNGGEQSTVSKTWNTRLEVSTEQKQNGRSRL